MDLLALQIVLQVLRPLDFALVALVTVWLFGSMLAVYSFSNQWVSAALSEELSSSLWIQQGPWPELIEEDQISTIQYC